LPICSKVATPCCFEFLLHEAGEIPDKTLLNQVNGMDAVNGFKYCYGVWMFAPSFYLKQKSNEKSYQLVS
jgi:hypothetical protein